MNIHATIFKPSNLSRALAVLTLTGAGASAVALPSFTLNPASAGLAGTAFTADNILISDFSTVTLTGTTFTDVGFLNVSGFQLGGSTLVPAGLNSGYGLYIAFSGAGTTSTGNLGTTPTFGSFTTLNYTLFGYNGPASFGFTGNTPTESAANEIVLGTGSLVPGTGTVSTSPAGGGLFTPSAAATLTFTAAANQSGFFSAPTPFFNTAFAAFTNTVSQVEAFDGGFRIRQGGGAFNFAQTVTPIPEPETYALMLAGLVGLGAIRSASRRRRG